MAIASYRIKLLPQSQKSATRPFQAVSGMQHACSGTVPDVPSPAQGQSHSDTAPPFPSNPKYTGSNKRLLLPLATTLCTYRTVETCLLPSLSGYGPFSSIPATPALRQNQYPQLRCRESLYGLFPGTKLYQRYNILLRLSF